MQPLIASRPYVRPAQARTASCMELSLVAIRQVKLRSALRNSSRSGGGSANAVNCDLRTSQPVRKRLHVPQERPSVKRAPFTVHLPSERPGWIVVGGGFYNTAPTFVVCSASSVCLKQYTQKSTQSRKVVECAEQPSRVPHVNVQKDTETSSPGQLTACTRIGTQQTER